MVDLDPQPDVTAPETSPRAEAPAPAPAQELKPLRQVNPLEQEALFEAERRSVGAAILEAEGLATDAVAEMCFATAATVFGDDSRLAYAALGYYKVASSMVSAKITIPVRLLVDPGGLGSQIIQVNVRGWEGFKDARNPSLSQDERIMGGARAVEAAGLDLMLGLAAGTEAVSALRPAAAPPRLPGAPGLSEAYELSELAGGTRPSAFPAAARVPEAPPDTVPASRPAEVAPETLEGADGARTTLPTIPTMDTPLEVEPAPCSLRGEALLEAGHGRGWFADEGPASGPRTDPAPPPEPESVPGKGLQNVSYTPEEAPRTPRVTGEAPETAPDTPRVVEENAGAQGSGPEIAEAPSSSLDPRLVAQFRERWAQQDLAAERAARPGPVQEAPPPQPIRFLDPETSPAPSVDAESGPPISARNTNVEVPGVGRVPVPSELVEPLPEVAGPARPPIRFLSDPPEQRLVEGGTAPGPGSQPGAVEPAPPQGPAGPRKVRPEDAPARSWEDWDWNEIERGDPKQGPPSSGPPREPK